jgi:hypothetical protein
MLQQASLATLGLVGTSSAAWSFFDGRYYPAAS